MVLRYESISNDAALASASVSVIVFGPLHAPATNKPSISVAEKLGAQLFYETACGTKCYFLIFD